MQNMERHTSDGSGDCNNDLHLLTQLQDEYYTITGPLN